MGKRLDTRLSEQDRLALEQVVKKSPDWRARERAKTLLLLSQPMLRREVAQVQDLNICTVGQTWRRWCQEGMAGLNDKPRVGAPRKLDEAAAQRLAQWAREQPLSAPELLARHTQAGEISLAYFDEAGFAQVQPNRSAWTVCGSMVQ